MKTLALTLLTGLMTFQIACVPSLYPLYTEQDVIFDSSLVGVWSGKNSRETWTVSICNGKKEYRLLHSDTNGKKGEFSAKLVRLGDHLFMDLFPLDTGSKNSDFYQGHLLPSHTFVRINKTAVGFRMSVLEPEWLEGYLATNPEAIKHQMVNGDIILTSSPKETQKFLLGHLNTPGAFSDPEELTRDKAER